MARVEKYLDDAQLASYPRVSIIHGKGTGALRQGVQDYLKKHRGVKTFRYGDMGEGGLGVTVVELKIETTKQRETIICLWTNLQKYC